MNTETNFMSFENLTKLIEEHKKETHPYKKYEFDSTSYTLLLIDINNLIKENQELKKQLEELQKEYEEFQEKASDIQFELRDDRDNYYERLQDKYREQKEFIKWLEDYIKLFDKKDIYEEGGCDTIEEILQKYREIIGENDV